MTNIELFWGFSALAVAVAGLVVAFIGILVEFQLMPTDIYNRVKAWYLFRKIEKVLDQLPPEKDEIPIHNYRHNIHCPSCGRFAKRVFDSNEMVECKHHGVLIRWKDLPIDWISRPIAPGVVLQTEMTPFTEYIQDEHITLNTGSIPVIVVPDDLSEFESWGARI